MFQENLQPKEYPIELHVAMQGWIKETMTQIRVQTSILRFHTDIDRAEIKYLKEKNNASKR